MFAAVAATTGITPNIRAEVKVRNSADDGDIPDNCVPAVAWQLDVHTSAVGLAPAPPAVVFRVRTTRGARPLPTLRGLGGAREHTLGAAESWRIVGTCR